MKNCIACNEPLNDEAKFCTECRAEQPEKEIEIEEQISVKNVSQLKQEMYPQPSPKKSHAAAIIIGVIGLVIGMVIMGIWRTRSSKQVPEPASITNLTDSFTEEPASTSSLTQSVSESAPASTTEQSAPVTTSTSITEQSVLEPASTSTTVQAAPVTTISSTPAKSMPETSSTSVSGESISIPHFSRVLVVNAIRMKGTDVEELQRRLLYLGFAGVGEVDGYYGPKTEEAIKTIQKFAGLEENGIVDSALWNYIFGNYESNIKNRMLTETE